MLFVSQFINTTVLDSADQTIGSIADLIVPLQIEQYPSITALAIRELGSKTVKIIPFSYVYHFSRDEVALKKRWSEIEAREIEAQEIWLYRDIIDKQIVDVEGTRVIRANDLQIAMLENKPCIMAIDISTRGIIRRAGLGWLWPSKILDTHLIDWKKVQVVGGSLKLATVSKDLVKLHPADLANIIEELNPSQSSNLMQSLDPSTAANVFEELAPQFKQQILKNIKPAQIGAILKKLPVDELVDYLKSLPKKNSQKLLAALNEQKKKTVRKLLQYDDDTAGGLMTADFVRGSPGWSVAEAREHIREISESHRTINALYLLNEKGELVGVVSLRSLIVGSPHQKLRSVMKRVRKHQTVHVKDPLENIAELITKYNLSSLAVLDGERKMLGVITVDDVMRRFVPHA